jgi:riboflavin kinase / FMN adenylyltransferase
VNIYRGFKEIGEIRNAVVTLGGFDGLHLGHKKIIDRLKEISDKEHRESLLITFDPHPRIVLEPEEYHFKLLTTNREKIELLNKYGIDHLLILPFTKDFSKISSRDFIKNYLVDKIRFKKIVIGYNHHFGIGREGTYAKLVEFSREFGFEIEQISAQAMDDIAISSTKIRKALNDGSIQTANQFLGYDYSVSGKVIHGNKVGNTLGFPTVNLGIEDKYKLIPANGVYAVIVETEGEFYKGMTNIGIRPTLNLKELTIETNIFDFDKNIYDQSVKLIFIDRIRDEVKFESLEMLKQQMVKDKMNAMKILFDR